MKYKGIELKEITTSQIFDPPKEMLVWNYVDSTPFKVTVHAIVASKTFPVIAKEGDYQYCAEIPEEPKPRRVTNRELSKWLAKGHGECMNPDSDSYSYADLSKANLASSTYTYSGISEANKEVPFYVKVRKWDDVDWHEPTVDYMGIE